MKNRNNFFSGGKWTETVWYCRLMSLQPSYRIITTSSPKNIFIHSSVEVHWHPHVQYLCCYYIGYDIFRWKRSVRRQCHPLCYPEPQLQLHEYGVTETMIYWLLLSGTLLRFPFGLHIAICQWAHGECLSIGSDSPLRTLALYIRIRGKWHISSSVFFSTPPINNFGWRRSSIKCDTSEKIVNGIH